MPESFYADITPGGAYFERTKDGPEPDPEMYWAFRSVSLGWGYSFTPFAKKGSVLEDFSMYPLVVLHKKHAAKHKIIDEKGDYVLVEPKKQREVGWGE